MAQHAARHVMCSGGGYGGAGVSRCGADRYGAGAGATVIEVNPDETPYSRMVTVSLRGAAGWFCRNWLRLLLVIVSFKGVNEIVFEVTQEADGYCAECLTESIFTQGDDWAALRANVREAVEAFYFDRPGSTPSAYIGGSASSTAEAS
jgi:hypothetical protein